MPSFQASKRRRGGEDSGGISSALISQTLPAAQTPTGKVSLRRSRITPRGRGPSPAPDSLPTRLAVNWRWVDPSLVPITAPRLAPVALGACFALASATRPSLAPSAAPITLGATAIASALATQRLLSSALEAAARRRTGAQGWPPSEAAVM